MHSRYETARSLVVALLAAAAAAALPACEDRSVPDDVQRARTGGIARVPRVGQGTSVGGGDRGAAGADDGDRDDTGAGVSGAGGNASLPGVGGAGGSAGIPGVGGVGGGAGIPGTGGVGGGSAGVPGEGGVGGSAGIPGTDAAGVDLAIPVPSAVVRANPGLGIGGSLGGVGTNLAPAASFTISPPCISELQTAVTLASSSVDPDGDSLRCSWELPSAVPNASEDCTVTVTFFDAVESPVVLFVDDGTRVSSAEAVIGTCPVTPAEPAFP